MLNGFGPISEREHRWFFAATSAGLAIWVVALAVAIVLPPPPPPPGIRISFGIYSLFDTWELISPLYSLAAFAICVPVAWKLNPARLTFSLFPLGLLTFFFDRWFVDTQYWIRDALLMNPDYEFKTFDFMLRAGSLVDVLTLLLVNVLVVWQITLLYRLHGVGR
jgi:hypothetical protein